MKFFLYGLLLLFIGLKLSDKIHWSWVEVLIPLWTRIGWFIAAILLEAYSNYKEKECKENGYVHKPKWQDRFEQLKKEREAKP